MTERMILTAVCRIDMLICSISLHCMFVTMIALLFFAFILIQFESSRWKLKKRKSNKHRLADATTEPWGHRAVLQARSTGKNR